MLFRGKCVETGIYLYGDLIHNKEKETFIFNAEFESATLKESINKVDKTTIQYYLNDQWNDL